MSTNPKLSKNPKDIIKPTDESAKKSATMPADFSVSELLALLEKKVKTENVGTKSMGTRLTSLQLHNGTIQDLITGLLILGELHSSVERTPTDQFDPGVDMVIQANCDGSVTVDVVDQALDFDDDGCDDLDDDEDTDDTDSDCLCHCDADHIESMVNFFESMYGQPLVCVQSERCSEVDCRFHKSNFEQH